MWKWQSWTLPSWSLQSWKPQPRSLQSCKLGVAVVEVVVVEVAVVEQVVAVAAEEVADVVVVAVVEVAVVKVAVAEVAVRSQGGRGGGWKLQECYELQGQIHRRSSSCTGAPLRFPKKGQRAACAATDPHTGCAQCNSQIHEVPGARASAKGQTTPRIQPRAKASVRCQKHDQQPKGNDPKGLESLLALLATNGLGRAEAAALDAREQPHGPRATVQPRGPPSEEACNTKHCAGQLCHA